MQYIDQETREHLYSLTMFSEHLHKKVTLLKYFRGYMNEHLLRAGDTIPTEQVRRPCGEMTRLPFLSAWFRTRNAIVLHLSNGIVQVAPASVTPIASSLEWGGGYNSMTWT